MRFTAVEVLVAPRTSLMASEIIGRWAETVTSPVSEFVTGDPSDAKAIRRRLRESTLCLACARSELVVTSEAEDLVTEATAEATTAASAALLAWEDAGGVGSVGGVGTVDLAAAR